MQFYPSDSNLLLLPVPTVSSFAAGSVCGFMPQVAEDVAFNVNFISIRDEPISDSILLLWLLNMEPSGCCFWGALESLSTCFSLWLFFLNISAFFVVCSFFFENDF